MDSCQTRTYKRVKRLDYEFWKELQDRQLDSDAPKGKENEVVLGQSEHDFPSSDDEQVIDSLLQLC